jgi:hypothetical protein
VFDGYTLWLSALYYHWSTFWIFTCQVQTRCRSFSNANRKDLRTAFMLHSVLGLSTLPLRLPFVLQLPFLHFSPAYDPSHRARTSLLTDCCHRVPVLFVVSDFLCCMIMNRDFCSTPSSAPCTTCPTKLECTHSQPSDFNFRCQSRICSAG